MMEEGSFLLLARTLCEAGCFQERLAGLRRHSDIAVSYAPDQLNYGVLSLRA